MAKPPTKRRPQYNLRLALDWGEKIARAIENPTFDDHHKLLFRYGRQTVPDRSRMPGKHNCRCFSIAADPDEPAELQRQLMAAFRDMCPGP